MKVAIGQDSHEFDFSKNTDKKLILGGVIFENHVPLLGNSDADVILHSLTNAISGITCVNIIGKVSDDMCKSRNYRQQSIFRRSIKTFKRKNRACFVFYRMQVT